MEILIISHSHRKPDMLNLTTAIEKAREVNVLWSINDFFSCIEKLTEEGFASSYWEAKRISQAFQVMKY